MCVAALHAHVSQNESKVARRAVPLSCARTRAVCMRWRETSVAVTAVPYVAVGVAPAATRVSNSTSDSDWCSKIIKLGVPHR